MQFSQILQLEVDATFVVPSSEQILAMLNEMGYSPSVTLTMDFLKSKLPSMWIFYVELLYDV